MAPRGVRAVAAVPLRGALGFLLRAPRLEVVGCWRLLGILRVGIHSKASGLGGCRAAACGWRGGLRAAR